MIVTSVDPLNVTIMIERTHARFLQHLFAGYSLELAVAHINEEFGLELMNVKTAACIFRQSGYSLVPALGPVDALSEDQSAPVLAEPTSTVH